MIPWDIRAAICFCRRSPNGCGLRRLTPTSSRFGGDEFVILQAPITSLDQAEELAGELLNALSGTYDLDGSKVVVSGSIGVAVAKGPTYPDQVLQNADMA